MEIDLPFLYLPDAVSLILLLAAFSMLRSAAIDHLRQELLLVRREMLSFWLDNGLDRTDAGYGAFRRLIDSSIRMAPELSPARLLFVHRWERRMAKRGMPEPAPDPALEVSRRIDATEPESGREKLKRLQMEMNLGLGTYFLMGSISSWALLIMIAPRLIRRSLGSRQGGRIDYFFDLTERVLGRLGRRALRLGRAMGSWTPIAP